MITNTQLKDVAERAIATYVQTFAGLLAAANLGVDALSDVSTVKALAVAAFPAALSVIKSAVASVGPVGDKSASLLKVGYEIIKVVEAPKKKAAKKVATVKKAPAKK